MCFCVCGALLILVWHLRHVVVLVSPRTAVMLGSAWVVEQLEHVGANLLCRVC